MKYIINNNRSYEILEDVTIKDEFLNPKYTYREYIVNYNDNILYIRMCNDYMFLEYTINDVKDEIAYLENASIEDEIKFGMVSYWKSILSKMILFKRDKTIDEVLFDPEKFWLAC